MQGATFETHTLKHKVVGKRLTYDYRWFVQGPLRDGKDAMVVNWIGITIIDAKDKRTYDRAFVTWLLVTRATVACANAVEDREREL